MKPPASLALALLAATAFAQTQIQTPGPPSDSNSSSSVPFSDPANLRGERTRASDGRELPIDLGASGLQQLLRKLSTRASILNIVAHPDDEDGGMLTLYARGLGARVADISLTRGEGGQNAITGDYEDALGLLRTQELLANDRYSGVDQMFGTEVDFGFSKTKAEAFAKWAHDRVLYDVVRAIRLYRPLVLTSTWIGGVTDGHGQHQVSGQIAQEAFVAAADPKVFPDMIAEGILPWQALRVYARVPQGAISDKGLYDYATNQFVPATFTNYVTGEVTTNVPSADVVVHEGATDPLLTDAAANPGDLPPSLTTNHKPPTTALSYVQFARIGLGLQRSQIGPGFRNAATGVFDVPYHLYGTAVLVPTQNLSSRPKAAHFAAVVERPAALHAPGKPLEPSSLEPNFFDGIDTSILSLQDIAPGAFPTDLIYDISRTIVASIKLLDPAHPDKIAPLLSEALQDDDTIIKAVEGWNGNATEKADALHELRIKRVQLNDALTMALGLSLDAILTQTEVIAGSTIHVNTTLTEASSELLSDVRESVTNASRDGLGDGYSAPRGPIVKKGTPLTRDLSLATPYTDLITQPYFYRDDTEQPDYKLRDPQLRNAAQTTPAITVQADITYHGIHISMSRVAHDGLQPGTIVPPVSIASRPAATVLPLAQSQAELTAILRSNAAVSANINVQSPKGWRIEAQAIPASATDAPHSIKFLLHPTATITGPQLFHVTAQTPDHHSYTEGYRPIGYGDLPRTNYYTPATTRIVPVDLNLPTHHNIAYLPGTGDAVPEALASIGLTPTILTVADLTLDHLKQYDTVMLGVRTYNAHPDLHGAPTQALLDYARNGGNVVVQYQTTEFTAADAPYPLSLGSNEKVVDETAPVTLLAQNSQAQNSKLDTNPAFVLLTTPNRISPTDFDNWIEERGHGFLSTWDPRYTALTETHDPGSAAEHVAPQAPQRGGLITTPLGKGRWTYVAFALYRQLPEAVPGAYRLFMNLINP